MAAVDIREESLQLDVVTGQVSIQFIGIARLSTIEMLTRNVMRNNIEALASAIDSLKTRVYESGYTYVDHTVDAFTDLAATDASLRYAFVVRVQVTELPKMLRVDAEWNF